MPTPPTLGDLVYRGLYAGISEIAHLTQTTRQNVNGGMLALDWFPSPQGYIYPELQRWPYWFLRDVKDALRRHDRLRADLPVSPRIEDWEYGYTGELIAAEGFARLGGFVSGNVHAVARDRAPVRPADKLRMGTVWRADEVREALAVAGFPKGVAA